MQTFKLDPTKLKRTRRITIIMSVLVWIIASVGGIYLASENTNTNISVIEILPIIIPIILVFMGAGLFFVLKRQKQMWISYQLTIEDDTITRTQANLPSLTINKNDLRDIVETGQGHLLLKPVRRTGMIKILSSIENREELIELLSTFKNIRKMKVSFSRKK